MARRKKVEDVVSDAVVGLEEAKASNDMIPPSEEKEAVPGASGGCTEDFCVTLPTAGEFISQKAAMKSKVDLAKVYIKEQKENQEILDRKKALNRP